MSSKIEAIQAEINQFETRSYADLERWERARLAALRVELKQLDPANIAKARALAILQRDRSDAQVRAAIRELADSMGEHGPGLLDIARKHNINV